MYLWIQIGWSQWNHDLLSNINGIGVVKDSPLSSLLAPS